MFSGWFSSILTFTTWLQCTYWWVFRISKAIQSPMKFFYLLCLKIPQNRTHLPEKDCKRRKRLVQKEVTKLPKQCSRISTPFGKKVQVYFCKNILPPTNQSCHWFVWKHTGYGEKNNEQFCRVLVAIQQKITSWWNKYSYMN